MDFAYYNGSYLPYDSIYVPLSDRAIFFGDGVYECLIGSGGKIYQWKEHIERLKNSLRAMRLSFLDFETLYNDAMELIKLSQLERYILYIQISRKSERRIHATSDFSKFNLLMTVTELSPFDSACTSLITREDVRYRMCNVKTLNLIPAVLASHDALLSGADEAVFIRDGVVTECAHSNIFILEGDRLLTHEEGNLILSGITRSTLIRLAMKYGIKTVECEFSPDRLFTADEVLITSTTRLVRRVAAIDGVALKMRNSALAERLIDMLRSDFIEFCC